MTLNQFHHKNWCGVDQTKIMRYDTKLLMKKGVLKKEGQVIEALPDTHFKVKLDDGKEIFAHLAGKLRIYRIKVLLGDRVTVEISPYDGEKGRIVYRGK